MSRISELAEAEAVAAEAEAELAPDEVAAQLEAEPEREPEAEPLEAESSAQLEAVGAKLDSESARHSRAVEKIMGSDFADVYPCPCCQIPGYVFPPTAGSAEFEQRRAETEAYFAAGGKPLRADPTVRLCPSCDGWGVRETGSHVMGQAERQCSDCLGQGWLAAEALAMAQAQPQPMPVYPAMTPVPGYNGGVSDQWGRPPGNPRYGEDPALNGGQW